MGSSRVKNPLSEENSRSTLIDRYIEGSDPSFKENANRDRSFSSMESFLSGEAIKRYVLSKYPEHVRKFHESGFIHIHNLTKGIVPYCFGADLRGLLYDGLHTNRISTKPARHFSSALDHIVNYMASVCQEFAGAVAFSDFNYLLAPYIRKDGLGEREIKQYIQSFVFNCNFPSRAGYESPFTNITLDLKCPSYLENEEALICGEKVGLYSDFEEEARSIVKKFNEIMLEGDALQRPFTFPIPTLNILSPDQIEKELDLDFFRTVSKYGIYYFFNYYNTGIVPGSKRSMCCRLLLDLDQLSSASGRWTFEGGTGSLGVVTINFPRIGFLSKEEDQIFGHLDAVLEVSKEVLKYKETFVKRSLDSSLLPIIKRSGIDLDRFFRTIGILGLDEFNMNFLGCHLSEDPSLVIKVLEYIRDWTKRTQKETGRLWNFELTPGEGSSWSLALKDREEFGDRIYTLGSGSEVYYSTLVTPPSEPLSIPERARIEEKILNLFTGGTVHRIFLGESWSSPEALKNFLKRFISTYKIPYIDLATEYSICPNCGHYIHGRGSSCPVCSSEMELYSRIVGYYRPLSRTNPGKEREIRDRKFMEGALSMDF